MNTKVIASLVFAPTKYIMKLLNRKGVRYVKAVLRCSETCRLVLYILLKYRKIMILNYFEHTFYLASQKLVINLQRREKA